ncbi:DUF2029 domain-containing protein, partial [Candidatus Aminicenantes bacterium AC-335-O07]|nr:DUF2029 domain-containing protein [Candidatus Aminicenantes bacterium AC-335-O07]
MGKNIKKAVLIAMILLLLFPLFEFKIRHNMVDFEVCYKAGKRFIKGEILYQLEDGHYQFKYPPFYSFIVTPISIFPLYFAKLIWYYLILIFIFFIFYFSYTLIPGNEKKWEVLIIPTLLILAKFYGRELDLGQANAFLVFLILTSIYYTIKGKEKIAGISLGLASAVKPYALIFFPYFLFRKKFKIFFISSVFFIFALLFPSIRYGWQGNIELLKKWQYTLSLSTPKLFNSQDNVSFFGFFSKLIFQDRIDLIYISSLISIITFFVLFILIARRKINRITFLLDCSILLIYIPLFSPLGWDYIFLTSTL